VLRSFCQPVIEPLARLACSRHSLELKMAQEERRTHACMSGNSEREVPESTVRIEFFLSIQNLCFEEPHVSVAVRHQLPLPFAVGGRFGSTHPTRMGLRVGVGRCVKHQALLTTLDQPAEDACFVGYSRCCLCSPACRSRSTVIVGNSHRIYS
jgi:hypothetical protein